MNNLHIDILITKKLTGEASASEQIEFNAWLNSSDKNKEEYNRIVLAHQLSTSKPDIEEKSLVFRKVKERIERDEMIDISRGAHNTSSAAWISIAAAVVILMSIGLFFFNEQKTVRSEDFLEMTLMEKVNPSGQKSKVFLPDGSIVWLNSESSLTYEKEFNDSVRMVVLKGQAYFVVKKDSLKPFVVKSGSVSTTALGTEFDINAFDEENILVALTRGKVNVVADNLPENEGSMILDPGEGFRYQSNSDLMVQKVSIDIEKVRSWKDGLLALNNESLDETITKLQRWYGVEIIINETPDKVWNANGLFDNEYLENVLTSLSFSQGFDYAIDGKKVFITFK